MPDEPLLGITEYREYPCVVPPERCPNKSTEKYHPSCHGQPAEQCYVNWASTDPEDVEPYEEYVAACRAKPVDPLTGRKPWM